MSRIFPEIGEYLAETWPELASHFGYQRERVEPSISQGPIDYGGAPASEIREPMPIERMPKIDPESQTPLGYIAKAQQGIRDTLGSPLENVDAPLHGLQQAMAGIGDIAKKNDPVSGAIRSVSPSSSFQSTPARENFAGSVIEIYPGVKWDGDKFRISMTTIGDARSAIRDWMSEMRRRGQDWFFRATNNKNEHMLGDFKSRNINTGELESGVSVSRHPHYKDYSGYKYMGVVRGDVVGVGSDGEPLLKNISWVVNPTSGKIPKKYTKENPLPFTEEIVNDDSRFIRE